MKKDIKMPCKEEVKKYLDVWDKDTRLVESEKAIRKVFEEYPKNNDLSEILIKASTLNTLYSTNIFSILPVAENILDLNIDEKLKNGETDIVNKIGKIKKFDKNFYSFASKYCCHHNQDEYPIYDYYVERCLVYFNRKEHFYDFTKKELRDYDTFKNVVIVFKEHFKLRDFSLRDIDKYLYSLGKENFKRYYKKSK